MVKFVFDSQKENIKNHKVFRGLCVDDRQKFTNLFLKPQFKLVNCYQDNKIIGYIIFEESDNVFIFHLVNFTMTTTKDMTCKVLEYFVYPYCKRLEITHIGANCERIAMSKKLEKYGFKKVSGNYYRAEVNHVF